MEPLPAALLQVGGVPFQVCTAIPPYFQVFHRCILEFSSDPSNYFGTVLHLLARRLSAVSTCSATLLLVPSRCLMLSG
jgi:hypothetical protein